MYFDLDYFTNADTYSMSFAYSLSIMSVLDANYVPSAALLATMSETAQRPFDFSKMYIIPWETVKKAVAASTAPVLPTKKARGGIRSVIKKPHRASRTIVKARASRKMGQARASRKMDQASASLIRQEGKMRYNLRR